VIRFAESCYSEGVVYAEVSVSPIGPLLSGVRVLDIFHGLMDGAQFARDRWQVEIRFEVEFYRGAPIDVVLMMTDAAAPFAGHTIVALGTAGSEGRMSLRPYLSAFEIAHSIGLLVTPHAGEMCGPKSVWDALEIKPDRIKHGGASLGDDALCERLVQSAVPLDMSLLSNIRLGYATSLNTHPFRGLTRRGITCGVGADDPAILGTTIIDEYVSAAILGADPQALAESSVDVSGLDQVTASAVRQRISGFDWSACDTALSRLALLRDADRGHCGARPKT
jgi:adenosine deaminase